MKSFGIVCTRLKNEKDEVLISLDGVEDIGIRARVCKDGKVQLSIKLPYEYKINRGKNKKSKKDKED